MFLIDVAFLNYFQTLDDLNYLKLKKGYEMQLKKVELQSSMVRLQMNFSPDQLKQTLREESSSILNDLVAKYVPSVLLRFFK